MEKWDCWNGLGDNDRDKDGERQTDRQTDRQTMAFLLVWEVLVRE